MAGSMGVLMPGAPLELSSGVCELSDTDDTQIYGHLIGSVATPTTWPIAAEYTANDQVWVAVINKDTIYAGFCDSNDTDSAVAQSNVGTYVAMRVSSLSGAVGYVTVDIGDTTSGDMLSVVDIASNVESSKYTTSDNPGVALVRHIGTLQG